MENKKIEISKVCIKIAGKELSLTIEQAKELQDILNKTFGQSTTTWVTYPVYYPSYPYIKQVYPNWTITYPEYVCGDNTSNTTLCLSGN
ncbi:hypothetical protein [Neomegalonema sp.]|uniref:hypothetical protein n=1 Tax=Neomegalonema sp. TaxID=2039713 RepID=UPI00260A5C15|nr:hypothetical protein [Neomegalonema sp.]MDD2869666.1 hypothetical protein [Neomegalonema sp.]